MSHSNITSVAIWTARYVVDSMIDAAPATDLHSIDMYHLVLWATTEHRTS